MLGVLLAVTLLLRVEGVQAIPRRPPDRLEAISKTTGAEDFSFWQAFLQQLIVLANSVHIDGQGDEASSQLLGPTDVLSGAGHVAFVFTGSAGATTEGVTLVRVVDGKAVLASIVERNGTHDEGGLFLVGSSVRHSDDVDFERSPDAFYTTHREMQGDGDAVTHCSVDAYRWNESSASFRWSRRLSRRIARSKCGR